MHHTVPSTLKLKVPLPHQDLDGLILVQFPDAEFGNFLPEVPSRQQILPEGISRDLAWKLGGSCSTLYI